MNGYCCLCGFAGQAARRFRLRVPAVAGPERFLCCAALLACRDNDPCDAELRGSRFRAFSRDFDRELLVRALDFFLARLCPLT